VRRNRVTREHRSARSLRFVEFHQVRDITYDEAGNTPLPYPACPGSAWRVSLEVVTDFSGQQVSTAKATPIQA